MILPEKDIMFIVPSFKGGSWKWFENLIPFLPKNFKVILIGYGKLPKDNLPSNLCVISIPFFDYVAFPCVGNNAFLSVLFDLPLICLSYLFFFLYSPKVVIPNGFVLSLQMLPLTFFFKKKMVVSHHGWLEHYTTGFIRRVVIFMCKYIDLVFVNSIGTKKDVSTIIDSSKIKITEHYAMPIFFKKYDRNKIRKNKKIESKFVVLYASRLDKEKNFDFFLYSAEKVLEIKKNVIFLIVGGTGDLKKEARNLQKKYPKNIILFPYIYDPKELAKVYVSSDISFSCADETYLARNGIESLACGTPIVQPNKPSITLKKVFDPTVVDPTLVPKEIGFYVKMEEVNSFYNLIVFLSENPDKLPNRDFIKRYAKKYYSIKNIKKTVKYIKFCVEVNSNAEKI